MNGVEVAERMRWNRISLVVYGGHTGLIKMLTTCLVTVCQWVSIGLIADLIAKHRTIHVGDRFVHKQRTITGLD